MNLINQVQLNLPPNFPYSFSWVAEYADGSIETEYNPEHNPKTTDFYSINKDKLLRYGYVGSGLRVFYDTSDGVYNVNGSRYSLHFRYNNRTYDLTSALGVKYNDIIQFKRRNAYFDPLSGATSGAMERDEIESYNIGWKTKVNVGNVSFNLTSYYQINTKGLPTLYVRIVPSADLDNAELVIVRDNVREYSYPCTMKENVGGELNWVVR